MTIPGTRDSPGAFVFIGLDPNIGFLDGSGVRLDRWGFVLTGHALVHDGEPPPGFGEAEPDILGTSVPGIFAAGDLRAGSTKQVASAAGEGATAALTIREYLQHLSGRQRPSPAVLRTTSDSDWHEVLRKTRSAL